MSIGMPWMLSNKKQSRTAPKVFSMGKGGEKHVEDAAKAKCTFSKIYDYILHEEYPSHADKLYKHGLRKPVVSSSQRMDDVYTTLVEKGVRNLAWCTAKTSSLF